MPSARPISTIRFGPTPRNRPSPISSGLHLALELVELRNPPRLDELTQAAGDSRADPAQLLHATRRDELRDRRLRLADRLGRAPVRTRGVVARTGKVEQACKRLQLLGDDRVIEPIHGGSLRTWRGSSCRSAELAVNNA